jgi:hypothetical protein
MLFTVLVNVPDSAEAASTPSSLELYWPTGVARDDVISTLFNQTPRSSASDSSAMVAQSACTWDLSSGTYSSASETVGIAVTSGASCKVGFDYTESIFEGPGDAIFDDLLLELTVSGYEPLELSTNDGEWFGLNRVNPVLYYGAFYDMVWVGSNGFVVLGNSDYVLKPGYEDPYPYAYPIGTPTGPNTMIAPLCQFLRPDLASGANGVYCGETSHGFTAIWNQVPNAAGHLQSFALVIHPIVWGASSTVTGVNYIQIAYKSVNLADGETWYAGMEDQAGQHHTHINPATDRANNLFADNGAYTAIKKVTISFQKQKWTASGWVLDDRSWIAATGTDSPSPAGINVQFEDPSVDLEYPGLTRAIVGVALSTTALAFTISSGGLAISIALLLDAGGLAVDFWDFVDALSPVGVCEDPDTDLGADKTELSGDVQMFARDEAVGTPFAWDVTVMSYLNWNLDADTTVKHRLTVSTVVDYGPCTSSEQADITGSLVTSNSIIIGPAPTVSDGMTEWLGRTIPDGHSFECLPVTVPTEYSPDGIGYIAQTGQSTDYGYRFMGWNGLTKETTFDHRVRSDGTLRVELWYKVIDTLPLEWASDSSARVCVMYSQSEAGVSDGAFDVAAEETLGTSKEWTFKRIDFSGLDPDRAVKIGVGRYDDTYGGYSGQLAVEWAGVQVFDKDEDGTDEWALMISAVSYMDGILPGTTTPSATTIYPPGINTNAHEYLDMTEIIVTATPADSGSRIYSISTDAFADETLGDRVTYYGTDTISFRITHDTYVWVLFMDADYRVLGIDCDSVAYCVPAKGSYYVPYSTADSTTITAYAYDSAIYAFDYWLLDGVQQSTTLPTITVPHDADHSVYAEFKFIGSIKPGGGGCVAEGTEITMANGDVKLVEDIVVGDRVLGYNLTTCEFVTEVVLDWTLKRVPRTLEINEGVLTVTLTDQPIYVRNGSWIGWIANPIELEIGFELFCPLSDSWVMITALEVEYGGEWVYDFTTDGPQTYLANSYLVFDKGARW